VSEGGRLDLAGPPWPVVHELNLAPPRNAVGPFFFSAAPGSRRISIPRATLAINRVTCYFTRGRSRRVSFACFAPASTSSRHAPCYKPRRNACSQRGRRAGAGPMEGNYRASPDACFLHGQDHAVANPSALVPAKKLYVCHQAKTHRNDALPSWPGASLVEHSTMSQTVRYGISRDRFTIRPQPVPPVWRSRPSCWP
jgi:hypothetical protein